MEAHGAPVGELAQNATGLLPRKWAAFVAEKYAIDRLEALINCIDTVRRGGTLSISGVYGAAHAYEIFQRKEGGAIKVVLKP